MKNNLEKEKLMIRREFNMIFENHKKITRKKLFESIMKKSNSLSKRGFNQILIEQGISDYLSTDYLSKMIGGGGSETIKEMVIKYFLEMIGAEGKLLNFLTVAGGNLEFSQIPKLLSPIKNCEVISDWLFDSSVEWLLKEGLDLMDLGDGWISSLIRNSLTKPLKDVEIKKNFTELFCNQIRSEVGNMNLSDIISKIKNEIK